MSESSLLIPPPVQSGRGFDDFQARCGAYYDAFRISQEKRGEDFLWYSDVKLADGLIMAHVRFNAGWSLTQIMERRGLNVLIPRVGGYEVTLDRQQVKARPGEILLARTQQLRHIKLHSNEMRPGTALYFDDATVDKVLSSLYDGETADCLDLVPVLDRSSHIGASLSAIAQSLETGAFVNDGLRKSPKAVALLTEAALTLIFENVPHRGSHRMSRRAPSVAPRHMHDAIDFMRAHLHQALTMADIAAAVGISVRALQVAFRRFYDTTPMLYLRRLRLEAVHEELSSPVNCLPVGEVAMKWGFLHLGRFAAHYRVAYGVNPSETAARAQRMMH